MLSQIKLSKDTVHIGSKEYLFVATSGVIDCCVNVSAQHILTTLNPNVRSGPSGHQVVRKFIISI